MNHAVIAVIAVIAFGGIAGCAAAYHDAPSPAHVRYACIEGLTVARLQELQAWVGDEMDLPGELPPPTIRCGSAEVMAEIYRKAGAAASVEYLGGYDSDTMTVWLADSRSYPAGNEHVLAHELAHYLQHAHGAYEVLSVELLELWAEAVHTQWIEERNAR